MNKGGSQQVGAVTVTMTHAVHSCGISEDDGVDRLRRRGGGLRPEIRRTAARSYFSGDTNVFMDMQLIAELYKPDLAFLPIGDLFTMSPREAAVACRLLQVPVVIPMHFGTFPPLTGRPEALQRLAKDTEDLGIAAGQDVTW